ncbi:hypothetical protein BAE44_0009414 [Dichanthelium oligosanthes]|uniref:DUF1618 domain-containing protein n=1 Tax=Dichanthelium oligosanthes TaxID=888268 RepID=A0A1E5VWR5_9POAL|nr:hypothetical protein BAE44_0009414 [Dichanthelium oligosanthes]
MPDPVAAARGFSGRPPAWVFLEEFASFGDLRNATTATGVTRAGRAVDVSFELVDPPGVSRWFVHCPVLKKERGFNGKPQILNAADALVVMRMLFLCRRGRVIDYFVYRAGPGKPSLELVPGPCPTVLFPKQVGVVPGGDGGAGDREHYSVVFPVQRLDPRFELEIFVFSSESLAWSSRVARFSKDPETTYGEPVLRLIQWPVPPPRDVFIDTASPLEARDATMSDGVIRFVELQLRHNGRCPSYFSNHATDHAWTASVWKRATSSVYGWGISHKADTSSIFADDMRRRSSSDRVLRKMRDDDAVKELDLNKMVTAGPRLSLQDEDIVYIEARTKVYSSDSKALLLAVNAREERLEAAEQIPLHLRFFYFFPTYLLKVS